MKTFAREPDRVEILRRLQKVRPDSTRRWGRMTAHQMICHCADACRMVDGTAAPEPLGAAWARPIVRVIALFTPLPWPRGIQTVPEFDQLSAGTPPTDFAADVAELTRMLEGIRRRGGQAWPSHPIFGRMSERAWLRWAWLHMDHHLRQFGL